MEENEEPVPDSAVEEAPAQETAESGDNTDAPAEPERQLTAPIMKRSLLEEKAFWQAVGAGVVTAFFACILSLHRLAGETLPHILSPTDPLQFQEIIPGLPLSRLLDWNLLLIEILQIAQGMNVPLRLFLSAFLWGCLLRVAVAVLNPSFRLLHAPPSANIGFFAPERWVLSLEWRFLKKTMHVLLVVGVPFGLLWGLTLLLPARHAGTVWAARSALLGMALWMGFHRYGLAGNYARPRLHRGNGRWLRQGLAGAFFGLLCFALGLALHPQFKSNHKFYVVYSAPLRTNAPPKWDHAERLSEFKTTGADFATADPASERVVLEIDEPDWNHNSGRLAFGPDGLLYWAVGDGGAPNDVGEVARGRGHPPEGNGQKLDTLLGKVLRLDVDHGTPYGIPKDNPYADGKKGLPEIFAYGLRNPWGISVDRGGKHDLIVVDVGQDRWEEINVIVNGGNYGWRLREGFDGFDPKNPRSAPTNAVTVGADGKPFVDPVYVYKTFRGPGTDQESYGVTITGGYVYRGKAIPALVGKYVFADWSRNMAFPDGTLLVATIPPPGTGATRWTVRA
jgi:hypothetical protein